MESKPLSLKNLTIVLITSILFDFGYCYSASKLCRRLGYKLRDNYVTSSLTAPSALRCVTLCEETLACISASWGANDHTCSLSVHGVWHVNNEIVEAAETFNTYSKMEWKVWIIGGPNGRYTLSYTEAATECAKRGARLATEAEILAERVRGLAFCHCSWLAEGTNGFVLQSLDRQCWATFNTEIIFCKFVKANAACTFDV